MSNHLYSRGQNRKGLLAWYFTTSRLRRFCRESVFPIVFLFAFGCFGDLTPQPNASKNRANAETIQIDISNILNGYEVRKPVANGTNDSTKLSHPPFGLHAVGSGLAIAKEANATFVRRIIRWQDAEPTKGKYRIAQGDSYVTNAQRLGLQIVVTLRPVSDWGVKVDYQAMKRKRPGSKPFMFSGPPKDMNTWLGFVRTLVERYDNDGANDMPGLTTSIQYWQIGNEVPWQWQGSMSEYATFFEQTAKTIREANPKAKVILGAFTECEGLAVGMGYGKQSHIWYQPGPQKSPLKIPRDQISQSKAFQLHKAKIDILLDKAAPFCDIIDFHQYGGEPESLAAVMDWLKSEMKKRNYEKSVWSLENAGPFFRFSESEFHHHIIKRYTVAVASGIDCLFWSSLYPTLAWSNQYQRLSLLDSRGQKKGAFQLYKLMATKFSAIKSMKRLEITPEIEAYMIVHGTSRSIIAWSTNSSGATISLKGVPEKRYTLTNFVLSNRRFEARTSSKTTSDELQLPPSSEPVLITFP